MADFNCEIPESENPIKPIKKGKKDKKQAKTKKEKKEKKGKKKKEIEEPEPLIDYRFEEEEPLEEQPIVLDYIPDENVDLKAKIKRLYIKNPEAVRRIIDDVRAGKSGVELDGLNEEQLNDIVELSRIEATSKLDRKVGTMAINKMTEALDYKLDLNGEFSSEVEEDKILQELSGEMMSENVLSLIPKPLVFAMLYSTHAGSAYVKNRMKHPKVPSKSTPIEDVKLIKPAVIKNNGEVTSKDLAVFE